MRLLGRVLIVFVCAVFLVACGGGGENDAPGDNASPPAGTPPPQSRMEVGEIIWAQAIDSSNGEPTEIVTSFTTQSPAIIAVIEADDIPVDTEFTATWTIDDQLIEGAEMDIAASEELPHAWIAFSFTRDPDQLYPPGQLGVTITTSEGHLREATVEIGFP